MTDKWHGGKGDKLRKTSNTNLYKKGWDNIFNKKANSERKNKK